MGQADSGVSGGAFDHSAARLDEAAALGVVQDELGRPVLDQPARVHVLGLDPDVSADFGGKRRELEKRRVAYGGRNVGATSGTNGGTKSGAVEMRRNRLAEKETLDIG
ncbi:hypothetical protein KEM56_005941, partial [Ascosphaera pollenicola]